MSLDLSIVIPAFNEAERIGPTLFDIHRWLQGPAADLRAEILVVDDGSSDNTVNFVNSLSGTIPNLSVLKSSPNRGKGFVVRLGMLAAKGRIVVMTDADGSVPAAQIPNLIEPILRREAEIVIGSRHVVGARADQKPPLYRRLWSKFSNRIVQAVLVPNIRDTQCGFKAFSRLSAQAIFPMTTIDGWAFDLEVLALAQRIGISIRETPVQWSNDERTKINPLSDMVKVTKEMFLIRRNLRNEKYGLLSSIP